MGKAGGSLKSVIILILYAQYVQQSNESKEQRFLHIFLM